MASSGRGTHPTRETTVSVVIPTKDRATMLLQALRSAVKQRSVDVEVVVVDDGSADGSRQAVMALADSRVRLMRHSVPRGVAAARNTGAEEAAGAWLAFLDDDDLWAPEKLARQLTAAVSAGAAWAYAGAVEIDGGGQILGGMPPPDPEDLVSALKRRNAMPAGSSNVMVTSEAFRASGGFDHRLRHLADWDLWLRLAEIGPPASASEPLVAYRIHPAQATLDTSGMMAEALVLEARHGIHVNSVRRWLAWSHLPQANRTAAVLEYARAAAAGDFASLGRAAVAMLHPRPTSLGRRGGHDPVWVASARTWIRDATRDKRDDATDAEP
jgi:glycosyltransferase involved in cell wall biosynthesis